MKFKSDVDVEAALAVSGDVGVGTTSPSFGTGGGLQISNAAQANLRFTDTSSATFITDLALSNENFYLINRSASGSLKFRVNSSNEALTILSSGNVGIGTTSPSYKLDVAGNIRVDSTSVAQIFLDSAASNDAVLNFHENASQKGKIGYDTSLGGIALVAGSGAFSTADMVLLDGGNVGIGTTSPTTTLDVRGDIKAEGANTPTISVKDTTNDLVGRLRAANSYVYLTADHGDTVNSSRIVFQVDGDSSAYVTNGLFAAETSVQFTTYGSGTETGTAAYALAVDSSGNVIETAVQGSPTGGSGTAGKITKWDTSSTLTDSVITESGNNLGIGVTPKTGGNTWQHIQFGGTGNIIGRISDSTVDAMFANNYYINSSNVDSHIITGAATRMFLNDGEIRFDTAPSAAADAAAVFTNRLFIANTGNVGIGTTSPAYKLDINGDFRVKDGSSAIAFNEYSNGATIWLDGSNGDFAGGDYFNISAYGTTDLAFGYAAGTKITMKSDGKLGIGTTSPTHLLTLETASSPGLKIKDTTQGATLLAFSQDSNSHVGTFSSHPLVLDTNSTERIRITSAGDVGIGTSAPGEKLTVNGKILLENSGTPIFTLKDTGNSGGGGAAGIIRFKNNGGDAIGIGYTGNDTTTSDLLISTNAASTYGGYLGLDANAILDPSSIILDPKTSVIINGDVVIGEHRIINLPSFNMGGGGVTDEYLVVCKQAPSGGGVDASGIQGRISFSRGSDGSFNNSHYMDINIQMSLDSGSVNTLDVTQFELYRDSTNPFFSQLEEIDIDGTKYVALKARSSGGGSDNHNYFEGSISDALDTNILSRVRASDSTVTVTAPQPTGFPITPYITKNQDGNVGIGTTTPTQKLEVAGNIKLSGYIVDSNSEIIDFAVNDLRVQGKHINAEFGVWARSYGTVRQMGIDGGASYMGLYTSGTEKVRIDTSGNVGIGTTSPSTSLHVVKDASWEVARFEADSYPTATVYSQAAAKYAQLNIYDTRINSEPTMELRADTPHFNIRLDDTGNVLTILDGGNVGIGTTSPTTKLYVDGGESTFNRGNSDGAIARFRGNNAEQAVIGTATSWFDSNVGIGTTNPVRRLDVDSAAASDIARFGNNSGNFTLGQTTNLTSLDLAADNAYRIRQGSTVPFYVKSDGNVGIGTSNPAQKLDVVGKMKISDDIILAQTNGRIDYDNGVSSGALRFFSTSGNTERMRIASSGNVGIGTTSPGTKLHVGTGSGATVDTGYQMVIDSAGIAGLQILSATNQSGRIVFGDSGDNDIGMIKYDHTDNSMGFRTNGSGNERMRINSSGNVGIGTTSPQSKLQVAGGIQMADDTAAASADKAGTMRYRTGTEYVEVNGTELVTNGDFAGGSQDWTKEAGWSIASSKASYDASSATNALYQSAGLTTGSVYKLSFTVIDYTSGSFKGHLSNGNATAATDAISANGDYSFNITATGALVLFRNVTSFNGSIDNVSVIEVTAEDASYADMCMQTGSSTYEWVNIVRNTY